MTTSCADKPEYIMPHSNTLQILQQNMMDAITGSDAFFNNLAKLQTMYQQGNVDAGLFLAWTYTQRGSITGFTQKSFTICQQIAEQTNHPRALEWMADLLLWGVGIEKDENQAFKLYENLVNSGHLPLTLLAYLHSQGIGTKKDEIQASTLLLKAAAQGDTLALILLAHRYKIGLGLPVNGVLARAYATLASKRKFPGADQKLHELKVRFASIKQSLVDKTVAALIKNIEGLDDKVQTLMRSIAPDNPVFATNFMQLLTMSLDELGIKDLSCNPEIRGYKITSVKSIPLTINTISDSPVLKTVPNFASFEECQYLIAQSQGVLKSTAEQLKHKNEISEVDAFSGDSAVLAGTQTSPVNRTIVQRFAKICKIPVAHFEPVSVLKYSKGHEYASHTDAFDENRIKNHEKIGDFGGQRISTNLIYLLPATKGGHTYYEAIDYTVIGDVGTAVIHFNARKDFTADSRSQHIGTKIQEGEKWLMRTASRRFALYGNNKTPL